MEWWIIIGLLCILPEASIYKANYKKKNQIQLMVHQSNKFCKFISSILHFVYEKEVIKIYELFKERKLQHL